MAKESTATKELTASDLGAVADEIAHETRQYRARFALAERLAGLKNLLHQEEQIRTRVADLRHQAATLANREEEIAGLDAEISRRRVAAEAEADIIRRRAHGDAEVIITNAKATGEIILDKAKDEAEQAAARAAEELRRRSDDIAALDTAVAEKQAELDRINRAIVDLRRKIGA
jgi:cell division septum initiation protein DivIVA